MRTIHLVGSLYNDFLLSELGKRLRDRGWNVLLHDFRTANSYNFDTNRVEPFTYFWGSKYLLSQKISRRLTSKYFVRRFLKEVVKPGDIINIHAVYSFYNQFVDDIKQSGAYLVCTFWGADILNVNPVVHDPIAPLLQNTDRISMVRSLHNNFSTKYPEYLNKVHPSRFGLKNLEVLEAHKTSVLRSKKIDYTKINLCIGYNGHVSQQHFEIINSLSVLPTHIKEVLNVFVPLTYGLSENYKSQIESELVNSEIKGELILNRFSDDELAEFKLNMDIEINMQVNDALSASITESLYAGTIMLLGEWLNYPEFNDLDLYYTPVSFENLSATLEKVIVQVVTEHEKSSHNAQKIYSFFTWTHTIDLWENLYTF